MLGNVPSDVGGYFPTPYKVKTKHTTVNTLLSFINIKLSHTTSSLRLAVLSVISELVIACKVVGLSLYHCG